MIKKLQLITAMFMATSVWGEITYLQCDLPERYQEYTDRYKSDPSLKGLELPKLKTIDVKLNSAGKGSMMSISSLSKKEHGIVVSRSSYAPKSETWKDDSVTLEWNTGYSYTTEFVNFRKTLKISRVDLTYKLDEETMEVKSGSYRGSCKTMDLTNYLERKKKLTDLVITTQQLERERAHEAKKRIEKTRKF